MPGLRPPDHRSATTGARDLSGARESSLALGCCSGTVTQAISSLVASPSPQLWATIMRPAARPFLPIRPRPRASRYVPLCPLPLDLSHG
jgi:hypothetical protein